MGAISEIMGAIIGSDVDLGDLYANIGTMGQEAQTAASQLAEQLPGMTAFRPFTVTSGTSQVAATPEGGFAIGLSPAAQAQQDVLRQQANYYLTQPAQGVNQLGLASQQAFNLANDPNRLAMTSPGAYAGFTGLQNQAGGLASQFLGSPAVGTDVSQLGGLQAMYQGMQGLGQVPAGTYATRGAAQQAFGLGGDFARAARTQPMDVSALRGQYGALARQAAGDVLAPMAGRESDVYERIRATQRPEEQRQQLALEERLAQQGRLGVRTAMFGGTQEQLALAQAQEEAQNRASLAAIQQAQAEQQQALGTAQALGGMFGQQAQLGSALQAQQAGLGAQFLGLGGTMAQQEQALRSAQQQRALQAMGAGQGLLTGGLGMQQAQLGLGATSAGLMGQLASQRQGLMSQNLQDVLAAQQMGAGLAGSSLGLQQAQQQLGLGAMGASYLPEQQALGMLSAATPYASIADVARRQGAQLYGETAMSGLDAAMAGQLGQANLIGGIVPGVVQGLGNVVSTGIEGIANYFASR